MNRELRKIAKVQFHQIDKYTMQAAVTIETEHSGRIEDLFKKPLWRYRSLRADCHHPAGTGDSAQRLTAARRSNILDAAMVTT